MDCLSPGPFGISRWKWDEVRYSQDPSQPTMLIKRLVKFQGFRIDLHKFIRPDAVKCFHSHPAKAIRIVLWGGYTEEVYLGELTPSRLIPWCPGFFGVVYHHLVHRISSLHNGKCSYSLWIRWPVRHKVYKVGDGWNGPSEIPPSNPQAT